MKPLRVDDLDIDDFKTIVTLTKLKDLENLAKSLSIPLFDDGEFIFLCFGTFIFQWQKPTKNKETKEDQILGEIGLEIRDL